MLLIKIPVRLLPLHYNRNPSRRQVNRTLGRSLTLSLKGWEALGWPENAVWPPAAGFKYLVGVPPRINAESPYSAAELFDFFVTTRCFVKFSTSRSFDPENADYIRIVVMQEPAQMQEVFRRLANAGVNYEMELKAGLSQEYDAFLGSNTVSERRDF